MVMAMDHMPPSSPDPHEAQSALNEGRLHEHGGRLLEASERYQQSIDAAAIGAQPAIEAEARRRLAIVQHHQGHPDHALRQCHAGLALARSLGDSSLLASLLNTLGGLRFEQGEVDSARSVFEEARALRVTDPELLGRIEQNLGILANARGEFSTAETHYEESLKRFENIGNQQGSAIAHHNLGMMAADRGEWKEASEHFLRAGHLAEETEDTHLSGLCHLNHAEALHAQQLYEDARAEAESAFTTFHEMGAILDELDACRVIGMIFRDMGRLGLAETYLTTAVTLAVQMKAPLSEAEAQRELGILYHHLHRSAEAVTALESSVLLFERLEAHRDRAAAERCLSAMRGA